jgi:hypothetical protein
VATLGYVYFVQGEITKRIKIGFSAGWVPNRIADLQRGSSDKLILLREILGTTTLERRLHEKFSEYRSYGEWFEPGKDLIYFIEHYVPSDHEWRTLVKDAL